jgi:hypothetical protein
MSISGFTLLGIGFGGGLGIYLFLLLLSMGIAAFGAVQRQYPTVVLGMMATMFIFTAMYFHGQKTKAAPAAH